MRSIPLTVLLSVFATISLTPELESQRERRGRRDRGSVQELTSFTYKSVRFKAENWGSNVECGIYLPKGYDDEANAARRYPWILWLHGMSGSSGKFRGDGASTFDKLHQAGKIPEMILVTPSAGGRSTYMNGGRFGPEEDLILKDVWKHVHDNYRVSTERRERAIMGVSMGALGAMKMALKNPQLFGTVAVHSSPVLPADPADLSRYKRYASQIFGDPIDPKRWASEIPLALIAKKDAKTFKDLRIYFDAGSADRYGFGEPNVEFSKTLKKAGIAHTFKYIDGGGHSWGSGAIQHAMQFSLAFVAAGFAKPAKSDNADKARAAGADKAKAAKK